MYRDGLPGLCLLIQKKGDAFLSFRNNRVVNFTACFLKLNGEVTN
jgi:hypothetical protein